MRGNKKKLTKVVASAIMMAVIATTAPTAVVQAATVDELPGAVTQVSDDARTDVITPSGILTAKYDYTNTDEEGIKESTIILEKGMKINLLDYLTIEDDGLLSNSDTTGLKFHSSNKKVVVVNKKGTIAAKKAGTSVLTVKYGAQSIKLTVQVTGSQKYTKNKELAKLEKEISALVKKYDSVSDLNLTKAYALQDDLASICQKWDAFVIDPWADTTGVGVIRQKNTYKNVVAIENAGDFQQLVDILNHYKEKTNPLDKESTVAFKFKSAKVYASKAAVKVTLSKAATKNQVFATSEWNDHTLKNNKSMTTTLYGTITRMEDVIDSDGEIARVQADKLYEDLDNNYYYADSTNQISVQATIKAGAKAITFKPVNKYIPLEKGIYRLTVGELTTDFEVK